MKAKFILLVCVTLGVAWTVTAAESTQGHKYKLDSLVNKTIYFRFGSSIIDPVFEQNQQALNQMRSMLTDTAIISHIYSVYIVATASPDGSPSYNHTLAAQRSQAVKDYIEQHYPHINQTKIFTQSYVENWMRLRPMISSAATPYYSQIVSILDRHLTPQATEAQFKAIDSGRAWSHIVRNYLPKMRSGATLVIYTQNTTQSAEAPAPVPTPVPAPAAVQTEPTPVVEEFIISSYEPTRRPLFALKTNLLYDVMTALNLEVEVPIGQRWSIEGEYIFPWWLFDSKQYCLQSLSGSIEGRYWFGDRTDRRQLTGWFAGAYVGGGYYDVEWDDKGYQGEYIIPIALSGGYAHTIGRNLSLEYSLGVGYMRTSYREYDAQICSDGVKRLIRQRSDTFNWIGPTRIRVSLVWMINSKRLF